MAFREDFVWGAATSSFQIEGGFDKDGRGESIWDRFCRYPDRVMRGHSGEVACDHRNRFKEDVALMKAIGLKAYRFSIAWPRVQPDGLGQVSDEGLDFYSELVDELLANDIAPWVTLFHWDLPWNLHLRGGWLNPDISQYFEDYTRIVAERLGDRVSNWMTINEPQVISCMGYGTGEFAPGFRVSLNELLLISKNLFLSHGKSVRVIREVIDRPVHVGWAPVGVTAMPASDSEADIEAARQVSFDFTPPTKHEPQQLHRALWNSSWWMDPVYLGKFPEKALEAFAPHVPDNLLDDMDIIHQPMDFFAANIYHASLAAMVDGVPKLIDHDENMGSNTMGWDVTPDALYWASRFYHERYQLPVVITENGTPQTDFCLDGVVHDAARIDFIRGYLKGLDRAHTEGIPVEGYFYWSLLDNFEWASGYKQRFGLVHVDYKTQCRTLKDSAKYYAEVIRTNGACL
jgi:beta-glucosidase